MWRVFKLKTSYGRFALLSFVLLLAALLFMPMRAGREDSLRLQPGVLKMSVGDQYVVKCTLSSDDMDQRVRFASSDDRVAAINNDGTVYAMSSGECMITASASGGAEAQMQVIVAGVPMSDLALNVDELHMGKGQFSGLRASYNKDASDTRLQWISADESIVRVSPSGRLMGMGGGQTYVSVLSPSGLSATAKVFVEVESTAAHISPNGLTVGVGANVPLKVSYLPLDSTDSVRHWHSSNPGVLKVDENGVLHALSIGTSYVSVLTNDGLTEGMEVVVEAAPKDLQLDPAKATIERGDVLNMQVMFLEEDGTVDESISHLVIWNSSDPSVASVTQSGVVTALRSGTTKITAASDGFVAECKLNVQVSVNEIRLDQSEVYLLKEETANPIQLHWVVDPVDADDPTVRFESDNTQVALVSDTGLVTLTGGYGTAVIRAHNRSGAQAIFTVNVVTQLPEQTPAEEFAAEAAAFEAETQAYSEYGEDYNFGQEIDTSGFDASDWDEEESGFDDSGVDFDMYGDGSAAEFDMYGDGSYTEPVSEPMDEGFNAPEEDFAGYADEIPYEDEIIEEPAEEPVNANSVG